MSLFFSRLKLSQAPSACALDAILNPKEDGKRMDAHHRLLWAVFADRADRERDFLWRDEGGSKFLTLSARKPAASELFAFSDVDVKEFAPDLAVGDRLAFTLRANATRDRKGKGRVDVVMDALHSVPPDERAEARMTIADREGRAWLERQGARCSFRAEQVAVADYSVVALPWYRGKRSGQPQFGILDMTGVLTVTDPGAFLAAVASGFGRARAFGCGLMLIRRMP